MKICPACNKQEIKNDEIKCVRCSNIRTKNIIKIFEGVVVAGVALFGIIGFLKGKNGST